MNTRWIGLPLSILEGSNEHGEPRWSILDRDGVELADIGAWPVAAGPEIRDLLERMVEAVNDVPAAVS